MEPNQPSPKQNLLSKKKNIAIIAVALIIVLSAGLTAGLLVTSKNASPAMNNPTTNQNNPQSWIAIGDYATYQGQATILSMTVSFNARMEIIDLNQTHIQVSTNFTMTTPYGSTENTTTAWVSRENMTFQPDGLTLNSTYSTQLTLPNLGTRSCTVYEYTSDGISATYYIDNSVQWPIKMVMTSPAFEGQSYDMEINLLNTNIPGL